MSPEFPTLTYGAVFALMLAMALRPNAVPLLLQADH